MYSVSTNAFEVSSASSGRVRSDLKSASISAMRAAASASEMRRSSIFSISSSSLGTRRSSATPRGRPNSSTSWWPWYLFWRRKFVSCPSKTLTSSWSPARNAGKSSFACSQSRWKPA